MRRLFACTFVVAAVAALTACGSPSIEDGSVRCGAGDLCPPGFGCGGDGFCWRDPTGFDGGGPDARPALCGNSTLEAGETCDPPASCPTTCADDSNACTADVLTGTAATCNVVCSHDPIATCTDGDSCCPAGCNSTTDGECSATCGNGTVEAGETCDPPASCPSTCVDGNDCTTDTTTGSPENCNVSCGHSSILTCMNGDGCCPGGCTSVVDNDCSALCGNGAVEPGETCDPPGTCPTTCNDGNACTNDTLLGSAMNCNVSCSSTGIVACIHSDGCCPTGCNSAIDNNCSASCGNGLLEVGETCDPPSSCPASCSDGNSCTFDSSTGSAANCNLSCGHSGITSCTNGDGCCPGSCTAVTDTDCSATCGNSVLEPGETCDPPGSCPVTCNDGIACTIDTMTGTQANCNVACSHTSISTCANGDGCCPAGCTSATDNDCSASCGNGAIDTGETCDPPMSCPTYCYDGLSCTIDTMTGSPMNCNVVCSYPPITSCSDADGCCPPGCAGSDADPDCGSGCGGTGLGDGGVTPPPICGDGCCSPGECGTCLSDCPIGDAGGC